MEIKALLVKQVCKRNPATVWHRRVAISGHQRVCVLRFSRTPENARSLLSRAYIYRESPLQTRPLYVHKRCKPPSITFPNAHTVHYYMVDQYWFVGAASLGVIKVGVQDACPV